MLPVTLNLKMGLVRVYLIQSFSCGIFQRTQHILPLALARRIYFGFLPGNPIHPTRLRTPREIRFIEEEQMTPALGDHDHGGLER